MVTTLTKLVNNQTNCRIAFGKFEEIMNLSLIHLAVCTFAASTKNPVKTQGEMNKKKTRSVNSI